MGGMKIGNIVPRAGIKPASLAFWASVLRLQYIAPLMSPLYPRLPVYAAPCLGNQCRLLQSLLVWLSWETKDCHYNIVITLLDALALEFKSGLDHEQTNEI